MYRVSVGAPFGLRCGVVALLSALTVMAFAGDTADARWKKRKYIQSSSARMTSSSSDARYAHIVVDANSGDVLNASNADSLRHPASLTKIMTLYLLFERLEAGKMKLDTPLEVSANATEQAPTKLDLKAGQTIAVDDAIKALVTKSANDVAVVIAETIGGSEEDFAKLMTRKARALGMSRTVYKNASGLPDDEQVTTARDQALLAMAIQDRFPKYYRYFSTPSFTYRGRSIRNHNHLLGSVEGVDGIKTGYTQASGFNLVTSLRRGNRYIVAAVFGGRTAGQRDARMRELLNENVAEASTKRTAPKIAEASEPQAPRETKIAAAAKPAVAKPEAPAPAKIEGPARADAVTASIPAPRPAPGSTEPIKPNLVKTLSVKPGTVQTASLAPLTLWSPQPVTSQAHAALGGQAQMEALPPPPGARPGVLGVLRAIPEAEAKPAAPVQVAAAGEVTLASASPASVPAPSAPVAVAFASAQSAAPAREARVRSGWIIQVGAFEDENEAKEKLSSARSKANKLLGSADPFTESVVKGDKTYYRARFAGLKQDEAEAACKYLKRNDMACMAIRN